MNLTGHASIHRSLPCPPLQPVPNVDDAIPRQDPETVHQRLLKARPVCSKLELRSAGGCITMTQIIPISISQQTRNICITFIQCWANVEDVGPTLYKCYADVSCLLGYTERTMAVYGYYGAVITAGILIIIFSYLCVKIIIFYKVRCISCHVILKNRLEKIDTYSI